ncbi:hypothetical protein NGY2020029_33130 [Vibrio cholerae]
MHSEKKLNSINPENKIIANSAFESVTPLPPQRALNTTLKKNVYTDNIRSGLMILHILPNTDPLYRSDTFRTVNCLVNSQFFIKTENGLII